MLFIKLVICIVANFRKHFAFKVPTKNLRNNRLLEITMYHSVYADNFTLCRASRVVNELSQINLLGMPLIIFKKFLICNFIYFIICC